MIKFYKYKKFYILILSIILLASSLILFLSCSKENENVQPPYIETVINEFNTNAIITQFGVSTWQTNFFNTNIDNVSNFFVGKDFTKLDIETIKTKREEIIVLSYDNYLVYLYQKGNNVQVIWDNCDNLVGSILFPNSNTNKGDVLMAQIGVEKYPNDIENNPGIGMCYIYKLSDGRALIIDGGFDCNFKNIYNTLNKLEIRKKDNGKFDIAGWILTHGHIDHYGAIMSFASEYKDYADVSYLIYSFPLDQTLLSFSELYPPYFVEHINKYFPNAIHITPHAGLKYYIDNLTIEMFYTPEFIEDCDYINDSSLMFNTSIKDTKVLITGDAGERAFEVAWKMYEPNAFNADVLQIPHHGFFTGPRNIRPYDWFYVEKIYNSTNAKFGLLPMGTKLVGDSRNGRWTVIGELAYNRTHTKFLINNIGSNNNCIAYNQNDYNRFVDQVKQGTAKFSTCNGYNGVNMITSSSGLVTYIMASETEDMATIFNLNSQDVTVIYNSTFNEWLNN